MLVTTPQWEIRFADKAARRWLRTYGDRPLGRGMLPRKVCCWLEGMRGQRYGPSLILRRGRSLLVVRRQWPGSEHSIALVLELLNGHGSEVARTHGGLTRRESEVHHLMGEGKVDGEIALILTLSSGTVRKHVEHIRAKLGVENRTAAARLAWESGESSLAHP